MHKIKAVIFDFGRVISAQKPSSLFRAYEKDLGLAPGTINQIMFDSQAWQDALVGRISETEFWYGIGPALGLESCRMVDEFRKKRALIARSISAMGPVIVPPVGGT